MLEIKLEVDVLALQKNVKEIWLRLSVKLEENELAKKLLVLFLNLNFIPFLQFSIEQK